MRFHRVIVAVAVIALCLFALGSGISLADPINGVAGTKHNLSNGGSSQFTYAAGPGSDDQICVFCHTPHRANTNFKTRTVYNSTESGSYETSFGTPLLLWNRALANAGATSWQLYTSPSMSYNPLTVGVYSLMCLSCHDGIMAMNQLTTNPRGGASPLTLISGGERISDVFPTCPTGQGCPNIGGRNAGQDNIYLNNDHPVTIDYAAAQTSETNGFPSNPGLNALTTVKSTYPQIRFYPNPYSDNQSDTKYVECPSCHNPHDYGSEFYVTTPFLVMTMDYSALCRACHLK